MARVLPKYIQECNQILEILDEQPTKTWTQTQRELGERLGIAQPVLSLRLKLLIEEGKVRKGDPLPMRGRNHAIELLDATPFKDSIRQDRNDRVLDLNELGALELGEFSSEKIGAAVVQTLHALWEKEERNRLLLRQQDVAVRAFREKLEEEHDLVSRLEQEKEELAVQLEEAREVARKLNERIKMNHRSGHRAPIALSMDAESERILQILTSK